MRRNAAVIAAACMLLASLTTSSPAQSGLATNTYSPINEKLDVFPTTVSSYKSHDEAAALEKTRAGSGANATGEVLRRPNAVVTAPPASYLQSSATLSGKRSYKPVFFSALFPGAGELYMGYWKRGVVLMAAEVVAWTGYFSLRDKGLQTREDYEHFADQNWSIRSWIDNHPNIYPTFSGQGWTPAQMDSVGQTVSGNQTWPGYIPWVSREEDKQHFYENIGKYDWYISGWADYDPDAIVQMRDTDLRDQYRSMRIKSNDQLDDANRFIYLSLAARVFSLVETLILVNRDTAQDAQADLSNHFEFKSRPGLSSGEIALEYWFK